MDKSNDPKSGINKRSKSAKKREKGKSKDHPNEKHKNASSNQDMNHNKNFKEIPDNGNKGKLGDINGASCSMSLVEPDPEEPFLEEDIIDGFSIRSFTCLDDLEDFVKGKIKSSASQPSESSSATSSAAHKPKFDQSSPQLCSSGADTDGSISSSCSRATPPSATLLSDLPGTPGRHDRTEQPSDQQINDGMGTSEEDFKPLKRNNYCNSTKASGNEDSCHNSAGNSFSGTGNNSCSKPKKDVKAKKKSKMKSVEDNKEKMDIDYSSIVSNEDVEKKLESKVVSDMLDSHNNDNCNESQIQVLSEKLGNTGGDMDSMEVCSTGDTNSDTEIEDEKMDMSSPLNEFCDSLELPSKYKGNILDTTTTSMMSTELQNWSNVSDQDTSNPAKFPPNLPDVVLPIDPKLPPKSVCDSHNINSKESSLHVQNLDQSESLVENLKPDLISVQTTSNVPSNIGKITDSSTADLNVLVTHSKNELIKNSSIKVEKDPFSPKIQQAFLENNKITVAACKDLSGKCTNHVLETSIKASALKKLESQVKHNGPLSPLNKPFDNQPVHQHWQDIQHPTLMAEIKKEDVPPLALHSTKHVNQPGHLHKHRQQHNQPHLNNQTRQDPHESYGGVNRPTEKSLDRYGMKYPGSHKAADASAPVKNVQSHSQHISGTVNRAHHHLPHHHQHPPPLTSSHSKSGTNSPVPVHSGGYPPFNNKGNLGYRPHHHQPSVSSTVNNTLATVSTSSTTTTSFSKLGLSSSSLHSASSGLSPRAVTPASTLPTCISNAISSSSVPSQSLGIYHHKRTNNNVHHASINSLPVSTSSSLSSSSSAANSNPTVSQHSNLYHPRVTREQPKPIPGLSGTRPEPHYGEEQLQHSFRSSLTNNPTSLSLPFSTQQKCAELHSRDLINRKESSSHFPLRPPASSSNPSNVSHQSVLTSSYTLPSHPPLPVPHSTHHISPSLSASLTSSLHPGTSALNLNIPPLSQPSVGPPPLASSLPLPLGLHRESTSLGSLHPTASVLPGGSHAFNNPTAGMFAPPLPPLPPTSSALPLPSIVPPYGSSDTLPNADLISQAQRDLNNRFLQDRFGASLNSLSPYIRAEMHNHQHQHLHQHNHTHLPGAQSNGSSSFPHPPSPLLAPSVSHLKTPPAHHHHHHPHTHHPSPSSATALRPLHPSTTALMAAEMDSAAKSPQSAQYDKLTPKLDSPYSPFRSPSAVPGLPGYTGLGPLPQLPGLPPSVGATPTGLGSGLQGAFQPKNLGSAPSSMHHAQLLMTLRDREKAASAAVAGVSPSSQQPSASSTPSVKKSGKWCAAHVRIAWEIHMHQQKQKAESARGSVDHKLAGLDPLVGPPHPSHLLATSAGASLQGLHRPELASSLLAASQHNRSPYESNPPGHPAASLLNPAHLALSPYARPSPYQLPGMGGAAAAAAAFGSLGSIPNGLYPGAREGGLPGTAGPLAGLSNPQEWNRLHRTPPSFPQPPSTYSKSDLAEKEKEHSLRHHREGSRDREREAVERDRELREKEREREYSLSRQSPIRLDSREHSSGRNSLDIERLREKDRSECNSRDSFTERSRSRSPLRNGPENGSGISKLDSSLSSRNGTPLLNSSKVKDERKDDVVILDDRDLHREKQNGFRHDLLLGGKSDMRGPSESYLPPSSLSSLERNRFLPPFGHGSTAGLSPLWNHYDIERQRLDFHREFERQKEHMLNRISTMDRERLAEYERHKSGVLPPPPPSGGLRLPGDSHPGYGLHSISSSSNIAGVTGSSLSSGHNPHHLRGVSPLLNHSANHPHPPTTVSSSNSSSSSSSNKTGVVIVPPASSVTSSISVSNSSTPSGGIPPPPTLIPTNSSSTASTTHSHSNSPTLIKSKSSSPILVVNNIDVSPKERPTVNGIDVE